VSLAGYSACRAQHRGFALIEVLVTLVIVSTAAAIILAHLRTMLDLHRNSRVQERAASATLNQVALLRTVDVARLVATVRGERIEIRRRGEPAPLAEVHNLSLSEKEPVPVDRAYTPFQVFRIAPAARYPLPLIQRGLPPPEFSR